MTEQKARELAIDNYHARRADAEMDSSDNGCHGIIGVNTQNKLLNYLINDYLAAINDKEIEKHASREPTPRGRHVNYPRWNDL